MDSIRKFIDFDVKTVDGEDRVLSAIASTGARDRDGDIIEPNGWKLSNFKKNPVILWGHSYTGKDALPIANATEIKVEDGKLKFKAKFIEKEIYEFADTVYKMYRNGYLRTFSVGFMPIKYEEFEENDRKGYRMTSQELLEISGCPVPSNAEAIAERGMKDIMAKSFDLIKPDETIYNKTVIPYKNTGQEPEEDVWEAAKEVREADTDDLKIMCTWYNAEEPDIKTSYKLPHHKASGYKVVWRGVAAAMGALLGARGGVQIPDNDRKGVYNHLARHYKEFDKEPPEFKSYTESELKQIFNDVWYEELGDIVTNELELKDIESFVKSGRVLSEKNRSLVKNCIEMLTELYNASETEKEADELSKKEKEELDKIGEDIAKIKKQFASCC